MTIIANTYLTFSAIGMREDLSDRIYNISSVDVPFQNAIDKNSASATLHEWQTDALAAAAANAQIQGDDVAYAAAVPTARVSNRTQISRKEVIISGTLEAVNKAGRTKEMILQMMKKSKELTRDIEFVLCSNQAPVTGNSTTAPQLRPLCGWYATNDLRGAGGADGTTSAAATDGTQRTLTETLFQSGMQLAWAQGGNPTLALTGPKQKVVISAFTGGTTKFDKSEDGKVRTDVAVYASDFGTVSITASRFVRGAATIADREVHLLDPDLWAKSVLRPRNTVDLAKTGDAEKAMILEEYTLESRQEAGNSIIADLT